MSTIHNRTGKLTALAAAVALLTAACGGGSSDSDTITLKYSAVVADNSSLGAAVNWFIDEVEKRTDGKVEFQTFFSGSLVGADEALHSLQDGRADVTQLAPPYYPAELPFDQLAGVPFLAENGEAAALAWHKMYEGNEAYKAQYDELGLEVLGFATIPGTVIGTSDPVTSLEDLSGLKIRSVGYLQRALADNGVSPVVLGVNEVYQSLQRGVISGFSGMPLDLASAASLHEVAPNWLVSGLGTYANAPLVTVNKEKFASLPEDVQQVMREVGGELPTRSAQIVSELEDEACETLREAGVKFSVLSEADQAAWKAKSADKVLKAWIAETGTIGVSEQEAQAFADAYTTAIVESVEDGSVTYTDGLTKCAES